MNPRTYYPAILGSCFAAFSACAFAQATNAAAPATGTSGAATSESHPAATTPTPAKAHHATKHRGTRAGRAGEPNVSSDEGQYRMALRQCVEGQASQRDRCLDDAISRYGKS
jgi:hypothetical protein